MRGKTLERVYNSHRFGRALQIHIRCHLTGTLEEVDLRIDQAHNRLHSWMTHTLLHFGRDDSLAEQSGKRRDKGHEWLLYCSSIKYLFSSLSITCLPLPKHLFVRALQSIRFIYFSSTIPLPKCWMICKAFLVSNGYLYTLINIPILVYAKPISESRLETMAKKTFTYGYTVMSQPLARPSLGGVKH